MATPSAMFLAAFAEWLKTLGTDAAALADELDKESTPPDAAAWIATGLSYVFRSLDLIPDGVDEIGYLDDAFVLRIAAEHAMREEGAGATSGLQSILGRLSGDAALVREFLAEDYARLERYVDGLRHAAARQPTIAQTVASMDARHGLATELRRFGANYELPVFHQVEKNLIKLRAFFGAKLPH